LAAWYADLLDRSAQLTRRRGARWIQPEDVAQATAMALLERSGPEAPQGCASHGRALEFGILRDAWSRELRTVCRFRRRNGVGGASDLESIPDPASLEPLDPAPATDADLVHLPATMRALAEEVLNGSPLARIAEQWQLPVDEVARLAAWARLRMTAQGRLLPAHVGRVKGEASAYRGRARIVLVRLMHEADWDTGLMRAELGLSDAALRQLARRSGVSRRRRERLGPRISRNLSHSETWRASVGESHAIGAHDASRAPSAPRHPIAELDPCCT
jgi:hypothetical protein